MFRNYQYRLYPNKTQTQALDHMLDAFRDLYNAALQERRDAWKRCKKSVTYYDQSNQLREIRNAGDELAQFSFTAALRTLRRLDKTFKAFFERIKRGDTPGFPRFKSHSRFNSVTYAFGDGAVLKDGRLRMVGIGPVKVNWHRPIPDNAKIKEAVVMRDSTGKWWVSFLIELPNIVLPTHDGPAVGVDLGLSALVTLSNGEKVAPPQYFRKAQAKLRRQQRRASRRKRYSKRQKKAYKLVAKTHQKIANQRKTFTHTLSRQLVNTHSLIAAEDLNILGLAKSNLAKSVTDAGWSQLLEMLAYKVEETGSQLIKVDPRGTSQFCSSCGCHVPKDLSVRVHHCPECGLVLDRDHNAAINILHRALNPPVAGGQALT